MAARRCAATAVAATAVAAAMIGCSSGRLGSPPEITGVLHLSEDRNEIDVSFDIRDDDLTRASVQVRYSADGGPFLPATVTSFSGLPGSVSGSSIRNVRATGDWSTCQMTWDSYANGVGLAGAETVTLELTPSDIDGEGAAVTYLLPVTVNNQYPELAVSPLVISFGEGVEGVTDPPDETITITNDGPAGTDLYWSLTGAPAWLTVPASGGPIVPGPGASVTLSAECAAPLLAAGSYSATLTITGEDGAANPAHEPLQTVQITFTVREPRPDIFIHDNAAPTPAPVTDLDFVAVDPAGLPIPPVAPAAQSFWVENAGETGTVLAWSSWDNVSSPDWLAYLPTENVAPGLAVGASEEVVVSVDPSVVGAGHYYATITASGEEITTLEPTLSGDRTVDVHLWVRVPPQMQLSTNAVTFSGAIEGYLPPSPAVLPVELRCGGEVDLAWTAAFVGAPPSWLTFGPGSGAVTAGGVDFDTITLTTDTLAPPADLPAGNHSAVIEFQDQYGVTTDLTVSIYVGTRATIVRGPPSLTFSAIQSGSNPADQTVSIWNTGDATLNWTADVSYTTGSGWLQLNFGAPPVSDTCTTEVDALYVTALTGTLPIGIYTATITITDAEATNSPVDVAVTLMVGGGSSVVITECDLGSPDFIEIQNVSGMAVDTTGWVVAISDSYSVINSVNSISWFLPATMSAGQVLYRTDGAVNPWGSNIFWDGSGDSWAMIVDDSGEIVDFVAWGWTAAEIAGMSTVVNGFPISIGSEFIGNGVPRPGVGTIQRQGNADNDNAADFVWGSPSSMGVTNAGLVLPFGP